MSISQAEKLFLDNVAYNSRMAKIRAKPKIHGFGFSLGGRKMTPVEVIKALDRLGAEITRRTLLNWEKWGLIPEPKRGGLGKGGGRFTDYPPDTLAEAYAAWFFLSGEFRMKVKNLKALREAALAIEGTDKELQLQFDLFADATRFERYVNEWLTEKARVLNELHPDDNLLTDTTDFWRIDPDGRRRRKLKKC